LIFLRVGEFEDKRSSLRSRDFNNLNALLTCSSESRLITPSVRCKLPRGLIAFSGMPFGRSFVTLSRKVVRLLRSWGREVGVTNGMQRKWVSLLGADLGGISEVMCWDVEFGTVGTRAHFGKAWRPHSLEAAHRTNVEEAEIVEPSSLSHAGMLESQSKGFRFD
jgi:hypothetical protein